MPSLATREATVVPLPFPRGLKRHIGKRHAARLDMSKLNEASRDHIDAEKFAFPKERKEPIHDAAHVRNAIARFNQVEGVSASERDAAWKRILAAAKKFGVEVDK